MRLSVIECIAAAMLLAGCGNERGSESATSRYDDGASFDNEQWSTPTADAYESASSASAYEQLYTCPMCGGERLIRHFYTGELMTCPACEGEGVVTADVIRQLQEAARMGEELAGGASGDNDGYPANASSPDVEWEIECCRNEIANIEAGLANVESVTLEAYYRNRITELQYRIRQLESYGR